MSKVIQPTNRDMAAALSIAAVIFCAFIALDGITEVFSGAQGILNDAGINSGYIKTAFKALGICYISELSASSCRDCGETALAGIIDLTARGAVALLMLPLLKEFIEIVRTVLS